MNLSPSEYAECNNGLAEQFKNLSLANIKCISLFLPMLERREPDTFLLIDWVKQNYPNIQLTFPQSDFATNSMIHFADDPELEIDSNNYGIPEPIAGNKIDNRQIDMVIAPLLVFDKRGYRVGYGKGFYDRFMAQCKPQTQFIGLSFFEPVDIIEDLDQYDIALHQCLTPKRIWLFNN
jgi:5-formyltetrahydrofolate cyclo-ligase